MRMRGGEFVVMWRSDPPEFTISRSRSLRGGIAILIQPPWVAPSFERREDESKFRAQFHECRVWFFCISQQCVYPHWVLGVLSLTAHDLVRTEQAGRTYHTDRGEWR